jgi:mono/diheme cytochrome c family protein
MKKKKNLPQPSKESSQPANYHKVTSRKPKRGGLGCSLALLVLLLGLTAGILLGGPRLLALVDQTGVAAPVVTDNTSPAALAARHNQELAQLNGYGWVDKEGNVARIPIERAIALVAQSNLPVGAVAVSQSTTATAPTAALANVNYEEHILPIFEQYCAECHGADEPEEGLLLTTYKGVMAGSFYGAVVKPGNPDDSYLVEMVVTGQMPKKGANLTQAEIDTIIAWINAGALEKGTGTAAPAEATVDLTNVSFQSDVLPIFTDRCAECHSTDEPEEGLVLTSYKDVMAGSFYGAVIRAGEPENSYLVELVSTGQMPKKGDDLTPIQIDTIVAWIKAGALDN